MLGRWYGVRGRRFVRPELILHTRDGEEGRLLAELDDKPWAAQDGEPWRATFAAGDALDAARAIELSVATDIVVALRGRPPRRRPAVPERRPRIPLDAPPPTFRATSSRPSGADGASPPGPSPAPDPSAASAAGPAPDAAELTRLRSRLVEADAALTRERERRHEAEAALERQRDETRGLSAEIGRVSSELAIAHAAQREAQATSGLLDSTRREQHSARERYESLAAEHDRTLRTTERLREQLDARTGELESARRALTGAREELGAARAELDGRGAHGGRTAHGEVAPAPLPAHHTDRPINPSLRSSSWLRRLLAVVVIAVVVIAVIVILHSTILH